MMQRRFIASLMSLGLVPMGLVTVWAPAALAQSYAGGQSGRALDANPGQGTGGINSGPVGGNPIDTRFRNDLVTGNVTGFGFFRDDVGYLAPGAFTDDLGSDDLQTFRFLSTPQAPGAAPLRAFETFDTPQTSPTGGDFRNQVVVVGGSRLVNLNDRNNPITDTRLGVNGNQFDPTRSFDPATVQGPSAFNPQSPQQLAQQPAVGPVRPASEPMPFAAAPQPTALDPASLESLRTLDTRIGEGPFEDQILAAPLVLPQGVTDTTAGPEPVDLSSSLILGQQLYSAQLTPDGSPQTSEASFDQLRYQIFEGQAQEQGGPTQDTVYGQLLEDIQSGQRSLTPNTQYSGDIPLELPSEQEVEDARRERLESRARLLGLTDDQGGVNLNLLDEDDLEGEDVDDDSPLGTLIQDLDYELPAIRTLVGENESRVAELMEQAEAELADGQYFTADNTYQRVLTLSPGEPMARIGRVHSLMSAGMIRSAALQLRLLFEEHPELIAARYDRRLLPPDAQLRRIDDDLKRMMNQPTTGDEVGIMMAYLGYQLDAPTLVRFGLDKAEVISPRDSLIPLLRRIWLEQD